MAASQCIDRLDLAAAKPSHRRTQSAKSSILKALISPVKQTRRTEREPLATPILESSRKDRVDDPPKLRSIAQTRSTIDSPTKDVSRPAEQKENVDPFYTHKRQRDEQRQDTRNGRSSHLPTLAKSRGRVMAAVSALQKKQTLPTKESNEPILDSETIDAEFEAMLEARNVAPHMREKMRNLTMRVKADLVKQEQLPMHSPTKARVSQDSTPPQDDGDDSRSTKRPRPRSRTFTFSKGDKHIESSPTKKRRGRSKSRTDTETTPRRPSLSRSRASSTAAAVRTETPETYITYLKAQTDPTQVEVGRLHKLRILIRNETVSWVDDFIALDGMSLINALLVSIMKLEWREEHEDQLLHETLLCLKGLCTTASAIAELERYADELLASLVAMLFDPERKGPAEFSTRGVIINILFSYLACKTHNSSEALENRANSILSYLSLSRATEDSQPLGFVVDMRTPRPYQAWAKEVSNVTREVFWIFLHQLNVIPLNRPSSADSASSASSSYITRHFPGARPPVPAAPYIGGVEWDAAMYLTAHLDLLNGLIAALPSQQSRNELRQQLQLSGFEKTMGGTMRTCKEKFYGGIHDGLRAWVSAAYEDGWPIDLVREGPSIEDQLKSARSSPQKSGKKKEPPPMLDEIKLECPALDLEVKGFMTNDETNDGWLG